LSKDAMIIFNAKRFEIATVPYVWGPMTMARLKALIGLSWGDLDSNIRYLSRHGLVTTRKVLTREGPRTLIALTERGRAAYEELARYLSGTLRRALESTTRDNH
jgi:DNA-binding MarR family transcriptional regulator